MEASLFGLYVLKREKILKHVRVKPKHYVG
jgi:phage gp46-like protein